MTIKVGNIVSHRDAREWGAGKVLDVTAAMVTIQFSDGKNRKIAATHFTTLEPAAASSYVPPVEVPPPVKTAFKTPRAPKAASKKK
ncbi:MAG: DUF3553 domain-containing protein [Geobacter sp.]|nr:DUF3553 domain-containing protein [Geobacter sp.]